MIIFPVWTCCYCFGYCGNVLMILMLLFGSDLKQEGKQQQDFLSVRPAEGFLLLFLNFLKPVKGFLGSFFYLRVWWQEVTDVWYLSLQTKPTRLVTVWRKTASHHIAVARSHSSLDEEGPAGFRPLHGLSTNKIWEWRLEVFSRGGSVCLLLLLLPLLLSQARTLKLKTSVQMISPKLYSPAQVNAHLPSG